MLNFIDYSESDDKFLIFEILAKKRCNPIYEDYINYKVELFDNLAKDLIDNNEYFSLAKIKIGRKYKNIEYNMISISNNYSINNFKFEVNKFTKEEFITLVKNTIKTVNELAPYYDKAKEICFLIKDKFDNKQINGLNFYINKNNVENSYLYNISLSRWCDESYASIYVWKDHIEDKFNNIIIDILDNNKEYEITKFILNTINKGIIKYNKKLITEKIKKQKREQVKQKELIRELSKERTQFKLIINKIINIFNNSKDKIIEYKNNYIIHNKCNLLYFKDYRNIEFIIHGGSNYLHEINPVKKDYSDDFRNYKLDCKLIEINPFSNNIYITETDNTYMIKHYIEKPNYDLSDVFTNSKINLSFRDMGYNTKCLSRYNFIDAINKLNNVLENISNMKRDCLNNIYETYTDKIYYPIKFTDENINKEIYRILYPIVYLLEKNTDERLNIKLNVDFTIQDGKKQPWLIKDFIEVLYKIGIINVRNII